MMISQEDFGIFSSCIDLDIVQSYPRLSYIRPRRPRSKLIRRPRAPVAAVAAKLVPVPVQMVGQSTEFQPQQPPPVASPTSSINIGIPAGQNELPVAAVVVVEAVAVTAVVAPPEPEEQPRKKAKRGAKSRPLVVPDWLPSGWTVGRKTRENGASAGNRDKFYRDPSGKRFRSKPEVLRHLDQLKLNPLSKSGKRKGRRGNIYRISLSKAIEEIFSEFLSNS